MGNVHEDGITGRLRTFIAGQPVFFVATAPLSADGHVNVSPKGHTGSLAVIDSWTVAYLDWTGSGAETAAHLAEPGNGRITLMWTAFQGPPNVVRVQGRGEVVRPGDPRWQELTALFPAYADEGTTTGVRAVVVVHADRVSDSCGFSVPLMEYQGERPLLREYFGRRTAEEHDEYRVRKNSVSIDGLPGFAATGPGAQRAAG